MNECKRLPFKTACGIGLIMVLTAACGHVGFTHAPPRTAVDVALAKKAEAVPTPTPSLAPAPSLAMPTKQESTMETVADYFTLGNLMMEQEKYAEAIKSYESAVKLDPTFADAWNHLAICYQNTGQNEKAVEAFKKYKAITQRQ